MKRKMYPKLLMVVLLILFSGFGFATDRYVAKTGDDGNTGGSGDPWLTIQHAIDNSVSGDVIHVAAGTYTQDLSIPAGKALELIGEGAGYSSVIQGVDQLPFTSWPLADANIEILGNETTIHGFTIKNPAWVDGFYSSGIVIGATDVEIYDNAFQVAGSDDFDDVSQGLQTYATMDISGLDVHDNTFTDLAASDAGFEGIYINKNVGVGTVTIHGNTFTGDVLRAISTEASNSTISDNSITTDLAPYPTGAGGWGGYQGINITAGVPPLAVSTVAVSGNTVTGSTTADGFAYGVVVGTSSTANTFSGISIANNFVYRNTVGIRVRDDAGGVTISNNSIHTNSSYCVKNDDPAAAALVANCNWWGTLGFNAGSVISGNITVITFLENGTDSDAGDPGFQPEATCTSVTCSDPSSLNYNFGITPAADSWLTHSNSLDQNTCAVYKLTLTVGKAYTFKTGCGNGATADFDTFLELYNASGEYVGQNDDGCTGYLSTISWTASQTTAYIKVRGYNWANYGDYTVAYEYTDPAAPTCKTPPDNDHEITADDWTALGEDAWDTHGPISLGSDACYIYKVNTTAGKEYTFKTGCGDGATADFDTFIELYNSEGTWISGNDDGCAEYRSTITWTATGTVYYVKVRGYNSTKYGDFTIGFMFTTPGGGGGGTCKTIPDNDLEITALDLAALGEDTWATDGPNTIASEGCYIYKVNTTAGKEYTFKTGCNNGASADFDTYIDLYNAAGTWVQGNDDGCSDYRSTITWTATEAIAYVKVRGYNNNSYGDFTLAYMYTTPAAGATCKTPPDNDLEITGDDWTALGEDTWATDGPNAIASEGCFIYKVNTTVGKEYTFKTGCANGATADFDTFMELYDSEGIWVAQNDDGCAEYRSTITWTATGTDYYVKVRGFNDNAFGDYTLAYMFTTPVAPVETCKTPPEFDELVVPAEDSWNTDTETLESDGCYVYKVTMTIGKEYTFKTGCGDGATAEFDTYIEVYNSTGTWITGNDDGCAEYRSTVTWTATETSAYVKVRGFNSSNYGDFTIAFEYTAPAAPTCKTPTEFDETLAAPTTNWQTDGPVSIGSGACYVYKLTVVADNVYTFKTGCTDGSTDFDSFIELYDADGVWITQDDDGCAVPSSGDYSSKLEWTASYSGNAYVKVRGFNSGAFGDFTLAYKYVEGGPDMPLGTSESLAVNLIKVFPNPADQSFVVISQDPVSFTRILMNQLTGTLVDSWSLDQPATSLRIESSNYAPGIYLLSIETSDGWIRKKVTIVR